MRRLAILAVLCLALAALVFGFGAQFNGSDAYPDAAAIDADYGDHVGETVHLWGTVSETEDGRVVVSAGSLSLRVTEPRASEVEVGDGIQIYGRLAPNRRFVTTAYDVQSPDERRNMYVISVGGIVLAGGAFLRRWRVDVDRWAFVPRGDE